jgi:hypothetical protein
MEVPAELASRFKFASQKSKLAGTIRGCYFAFEIPREGLLTPGLSRFAPAARLSDTGPDTLDEEVTAA